MSITIPTDPTVEMLVGSSYVDITADCRLGSADSGGGLEISRGKPNEGNKAEPTEFNFTLNNGLSKVPSTAGQSSVYSPNNPYSPYYGLLGRNQRVRVGLNRWTDNFTRTVVDGWGSLPDKTTLDGSVLPGERWKLTGSASTYDVSGTRGLIQGAAGIKLATFGVYADVDILAKMQVSTRDTEFGIAPRLKSTLMPTPTALADGFFENGINGWSSSATLTNDTGQFHSGTKSLKAVVVGAPSTVSIIGAVSADSMFGQCTPGGLYRQRFWARMSIGGTVRMQVSWYNASLVFQSSTTNDVVLSANTWTLCEFTHTAPQDGIYARSGPIIQGSPAAGTQFWMDDFEMLSLSDLYWYTVTVQPGGTDVLRIGKVTPGTSKGFNTNLVSNFVVNTDYYMRVQITGQRVRAKFWLATDPEPVPWYWRVFDDATVGETPVGLTGEAGFVVSGGTGLVSIDSVQVDQWRACAEITELPTRWDLSRSDRWVPIKARGITRRLGQGRKNLKSAVTLHLESYAANSSGWWPLETDSGESAGNSIPGGTDGAISGLEFQAPELSGLLAMPGVEGFATLTADTSSIVCQIPQHTVGSVENVLFFFKLPNTVASEAVVATFTTTGTVRKWNMVVGPSAGMRVDGYNATGTIITTASALMYFTPDNPQGCWLAMNMGMNQNGGNIDWSMNYHHPGQTTFFACNSSVAGTIGRFTSVTFRGNPVLTAAGNMSITQIFHQGATGLPFVTYDFRRAAYAYDGELSTARLLRLGANADLPVTTTGYSLTAEPMGFQLPAKLLDLLEECAEVEDGILMEERDDFGLTLVTRDSLWNRFKHVMDIDLGHMSAPLDPNTDDQLTRNDVTVSRPNGGFARAVQTSGPLNVNAPEVDPDGVGTYDESPTINMSTNSQLAPCANFRKSRGTQQGSRYPTIHADMAATAYLVSLSLAAALLSVDMGDVLEIDNPEVHPDPQEQQVQSYTESIDQFDHDINFVARPSSVYRVGVVGYTTRVGSVNNITQAAFTSGTDTRLKSTLVVTDPPGYPWVTLIDSEASFPFDVDVAGARLRVTATGDVLNDNPMFEDPLGMTGWAASSANVVLALDRFDPKRGAQSIRINALAAGTDGIIQAAANSCVTVAATGYLVSGWIKTEAAATDVRLTVDWYQSNNTTFISTSSPTPIVTVANTWTWYTAVITSPALGARARIRSRNVFAGATRMWNDALRLVPVASYNTTPQTLSVEQVPINGITKAIPIGSVIELAAPWVVGW